MYLHSYTPLLLFMIYKVTKFGDIIVSPKYFWNCLHSSVFSSVWLIDSKWKTSAQVDCGNDPFLPGWRFCSLWYIHHPTVHPPQLVWNLLQVREEIHCGQLYHRKQSVCFIVVNGWLYFFFYFRMIQNSFIDMESMFKLFEEDEEVLLKLANDCSVYHDPHFINMCCMCSLLQGERWSKCRESALQRGKSGVWECLLQLHKWVGPHVTL